MQELLGRAWNGWAEYAAGAKVTALLGAAILVMGLGHLKKERHRILWGYGAAAAVLCIFPPTAAILLKYQTKFYDYPWIWTLVPMTALIACAGTLLVIRLEREKGLKNWQKGLLILGGIAVIWLCGGSAAAGEKPRDMREERNRAAAVLSQLGDGEICLWAPREILAQARSLDGRITLAYGRNLWEAHLNAYSYDVYTARQEEMYQWMTLAAQNGLLDEEGADARGNRTVLRGTDMMEYALALGVDHILLPGCMEESAILALEDYLERKAERVEEYYLFRLDAGSRD